MSLRENVPREIVRGLVVQASVFVVPYFTVAHCIIGAFKDAESLSASHANATFPMAELASKAP
jgi:hypothetical protein